MDPDNLVDTIREHQKKASDKCQVFVARAAGAPQRIQAISLDEDGDIIIHIE